MAVISTQDGFNEIHMTKATMPPGHAHVIMATMPTEHAEIYMIKATMPTEKWSPHDKGYYAHWACWSPHDKGYYAHWACLSPHDKDYYAHWACWRTRPLTTCLSPCMLWKMMPGNLCYLHHLSSHCSLWSYLVFDPVLQHSCCCAQWKGATQVYLLKERGSFLPCLKKHIQRKLHILLYKSICTFYNHVLTSHEVILGTCWTVKIAIIIVIHVSKTTPSELIKGILINVTLEHYFCATLLSWEKTACRTQQADTC